MRNKLKLGLGVLLLLGAGCFSASVQAEEQAQSEAQAQTKTSDALPSFLPKDYKVTDTLWGEWVFKMDTYHLEGEPSYPNLDFKSGKSDIFFMASMYREKWEIAHNVPFKFKTEGGGGFEDTRGFTCRGENLKLWFDNGEFLPLENDNHFVCNQANREHDAFGDVPTGGAVEIKDCVEPVALYKLSDLIGSHKPVAVTQGKNVLLIKSKDESAIKTYQEKVNPKLNPDFFAELKKFSDSQKSLSL